MKFLQLASIIFILSYNSVYSQIQGNGLESISKDKVVYYTLGLSGWAESSTKWKNSFETIMKEKIKSSGLIAKKTESNLDINNRGCITLTIIFARNSVSLLIGYVRKVNYTDGKNNYSIMASTWEKNYLISDASIDLINKAVENLMDDFIREYIKQNFL